MRTLNLRPLPDGRMTLANPHLPPGYPPGSEDDNRVRPITRIVEIPDDVSDTEVVRLATVTANITWLKLEDIEADIPMHRRGRYTLRFNELGLGRIIRD